MKAAVVKETGHPPVYADFGAPQALPDHHLIDVSAAALSRVTRSRAAGAHYSSSGGYPFVAGVDGTGRLEDGQRVYFFGPPAPYGAMAERSLARASQCIALPDDLDDVTAAAIAIPGMSSWAALTERAKFVAGETVLINGATGASGQLAVRIARYLGAGKIIATGRNPVALAALKQAGADITISLIQDDDAKDDDGLSHTFAPHFAQGVDVVLDYLWGASARALLIAAAKHSPEGQPVRFVQIGSVGGNDVVLPGAVLRASAITLMGSGIGSVPLPRLLHAVKEVLHAARPAGLRIPTAAIPLAELGQHWALVDSPVRTVFTLDASAG
ncbi:quinone oxidoreductase family protein [Pandoraea norimbergensis]|uniref:Alcohol dehydrogenase n=1 Tax=Pandoraea norimbergensis TaxID=93219 RepID=A0ABM7D5V0_9BURK|nr:zinc-binding alcohol dehydrogenase family protein [Pandoraea norimbergensis]ALS60394.1 alcohol dehydrogenase [Pandoraea norimbergensis]